LFNSKILGFDIMSKEINVITIYLTIYGANFLISNSKSIIT